ncbi:hypothetical protein GCM10010149_47540 [Nonomuraea roseoviolacea subsp. roseoviolacea]|uniref:hypothetical protein n=1 Tax=Nonomuraea roseoviolacea TaxID=103837 RepID=UPI0031E41408
MSKAKAAIAEATGETVPVDYDGTVYTVPTPIDWDIDVLDELEAGRFTRALKLVLGADQYDAFKAAKPRKLSDAVQMWDAISTACGTGSAGN